MQRSGENGEVRIRRRPDGSIDTEHYLAKGRRARSEQAHRLLKPGGRTRAAPAYPFSRSTLPAR